MDVVEEKEETKLVAGLGSIECEQLETILQRVILRGCEVDDEEIVLKAMRAKRILREAKATTAATS